jgi:hypothetical protein
MLQNIKVISKAMIANFMSLLLDSPQNVTGWIEMASNDKKRSTDSLIRRSVGLIMVRDRIEKPLGRLIVRISRRWDIIKGQGYNALAGRFVENGIREKARYLRNQPLLRRDILGP